jgi:hypothetical protein
MDEGSPAVARALRIARLTAVLVAAVVAAVYLAHAIALARYPWDWSPDEGLFLDYARRLLHAPGTLYGRTVVPIPLVYTPLFVLSLAPLVDLPHPLQPARLLQVAWTALLVGAAYALVRQRAGRPLAAVTASLVLAPLGISFWYMLVRVDALMIALWTASAVWLLPRRLARGEDRLGRGRLLAGAAVLLAAVLAKPTAALHGARPLELLLLLAVVHPQPRFRGLFLRDELQSFLRGLLAAVRTPIVVGLVRRNPEQPRLEPAAPGGRVEPRQVLQYAEPRLLVKFFGQLVVPAQPLEVTDQRLIIATHQFFTGRAGPRAHSLDELLIAHGDRQAVFGSCSAHHAHSGRYLNNG